MIPVYVIFAKGVVLGDCIPRLGLQVAGGHSLCEVKLDYTQTRTLSLHHYHN